MYVDTKQRIVCECITMLTSKNLRHNHNMGTDNSYKQFMRNDAIINRRSMLYYVSLHHIK